MKTIKTIAASLCLSTALLAAPLQAANEEVIDALEGYLMFVDYAGATIAPEQIPAEEWSNFFVIDARNAEQYAAGHIEGAVNIEWRQVLDHRDEIPTDQAVLIYCDTGAISAQAGVILRVVGFDNVRILRGGYDNWLAAGGFDAHRLAQEAQ